MQRSLWIAAVEVAVARNRGRLSLSMADLRPLRHTVMVDRGPEPTALDRSAFIAEAGGTLAPEGERRVDLALKDLGRGRSGPQD